MACIRLRLRCNSNLPKSVIEVSHFCYVSPVDLVLECHYVFMKFGFSGQEAIQCYLFYSLYIVLGQPSQICYSSFPFLLAVVAKPLSESFGALDLSQKC